MLWSMKDQQALKWPDTWVLLLLNGCMYAMKMVEKWQKEPNNWRRHAGSRLDES